MKKTMMIVLAALFLLAAGTAIVSAETNPLMGTWKMSMVFVPEEVRFEFRDDGTYTVVDQYQDESTYDYFLADDNSTLTLQMDEESILDWRYEIDKQDKDVLYLYMREDGNDWFFEEFLQSMFYMDQEHINDLTDSFFESMQEAVRKVFVTEPFLKGERIK